MDTPGRLLQLLAMMSSRPVWRAGDLAARLEVTERSIRRDMTRLRDLGYPIESVTGPYGGYSLGAGGRLPPLLLDDDEAVSIAVALHELANRGSPALADGALSALTKIGQVMPVPLRERVSALSAVVVDVSRSSRPGAEADRPPSADHVDTLMVVALACSRSERLRFDYRAGDGTETVRHTEPFRLVSHGRTWYLVANDLDRKDWRTFRVDRMTRPRNNGERFARGETPDAAAFVAAGIAVNAYDERATFRFPVPVDVLAREIPATIGIIASDPTDPTCSTAQIGGDADWIARFVASLPFPCEVLDSDEVAGALRDLGRRLVRDHRRDDAAFVSSVSSARPGGR